MISERKVNMFINKKITAMVAAVAMAVTSFATMIVASAEDLPVINVDYLTADDASNGGDCAVKISMGENADGLKSFMFNIDIPGAYVGLKDGKDFYDLTNDVATFKDLCYAKRNTTFKSALTGASAYKIATVGELTTYQLQISAPAGSKYAVGDWLEIDFNFATGKTLADLPVGSFKLTNVKGGKDLSISALDLTSAVVNNAEVKGGAAETTPVITPAEGQTDYEAAAAFEGYAAAEKVGNYTGDVADDKATAFKATVSGTSTTGEVIWKVTDGVDTKYHKMSTGATFTGGGNAVIGLAVEGLADGTASVAFLK